MNDYRQAASSFTLKSKEVPPKKKPVSVRLDDDIVAKLDELTNSSGYSRSEIINTLLRKTVFNVSVS